MKALRPLALPVLLCLRLSASNLVTPPRIGLVRYADGGVYSLNGVTGNYVVGQRILDSVDELSFSQGGGLVVRQGVLLLIDSSLQTVASLDAGPDKPTVAIGRSLESALAWLPTRHLLVYSDGVALRSVAVADSTWTGQVIGLEKVNSDTASLLMLNSDGSSVEQAKISLGTGAVLSLSNVAAVSGPVFCEADRLIWLKAGKLNVTSISTGEVQSVPMKAQDLTFERLSDDAIHLHSPSSGRDWLLHSSGHKPDDQPVLYELPAPPYGGAK